MPKNFKHLVLLIALGLNLALPAFAQTPSCPSTHFPCGGQLCCSK